MKTEVVRITRTRGSTAVMVKNQTRKIEYVFGATDATDEELTADFEASPKEAAAKYDAQINLV